MRRCGGRRCWRVACASPRSLAPRPPRGGDRSPTPVFAYYYIWFNPSSWKRAKTDYPLLGPYSSDERTVMRQHVRLGEAAPASTASS